MRKRISLGAMLAACCFLLCSCTPKAADTTETTASATMATLVRLIEETEKPETETTTLQTTILTGGQKIEQLFGLYQKLFSRMRASQWMERTWDLLKNYDLDLSEIDLEDPADTLIYSCVSLAVIDLNEDNMPEILLRWEEAEIGVHLISVENGKIHITQYICVDNQTGEDKVYLYRTQDGHRMVIASGATGTGAGNYYFTEYFDADMKPHAANFSALDDYNGDEDTFVKVYQVNNENVEQTVYDQARAAFFEPLILEKEILFTPLDDDPMNTLKNMLADFFNQVME